MIHDQMCYRSHDNPLGPDPFCQCDLIAKVREDTIAAAVQRVEAFEYVSTIGVVLSSVVPKAAVIALIKGDQP